jgi:hypothetical protein
MSYDLSIADTGKFAPSGKIRPDRVSTGPQVPSNSGAGPSGGGGGPGPGGGPPRPESEKELSLSELAAQYGYAAAFFRSDAELKKLIQQAVKEQWSTAKFQAKFMASKWYKRHTASARTWLELEARDPKEAGSRIAEQTRAIRAQANQMGISLSGGRAKKMARESLMLGWSPQLLTDAIADEFKYRPGETSGQAASMETFISSTAADYGVKVSDSRVGSWLGRTLRGDFTEENIVDLVTDMARTRYPGLVELLDQGRTVADVAEPYRDSYSRLLEVPISAVDLFDPHLQKALQGTRSATKAGSASEPPQMQNMFDFERDLRRDARWQRTRNARDSVMNATHGVLKDWGLYA